MHIIIIIITWRSPIIDNHIQSSHLLEYLMCAVRVTDGLRMGWGYPRHQL